jgi:hypothetical protein
MKKTLIWILAVVLTLGAAYYQRKTGPTHPRDVEVTLNGITYDFSLLRSHGGDDDMPVEVVISDASVTGAVIWKRFPTAEPWDTAVMQRSGDTLRAFLPHQPPAGKLAYRIVLQTADEEVMVPADEPVVTRFKGAVPAGILIPHILFMFTAMLLSTLAGLMALWKIPVYRKYSYITLVLLLIGGGILGPLVQLHAFGALWTGIPFGWDLTDNKTLIAIVFWVYAVLAIRRKERHWPVVLAALVLILVYSIPHSMFGSTYNYETGNVIQGSLLLILRVSSIKKEARKPLFLLPIIFFIPRPTRRRKSACS